MQDQCANVNYIFVLQERCYFQRHPQTKVPRSKQTYIVGDTEDESDLSTEKCKTLSKNICEDKYMDSDTMFMDRTHCTHKKVNSF